VLQKRWLQKRCQAAKKVSGKKGEAKKQAKKVSAGKKGGRQKRCQVPFPTPLPISALFKIKGT
jgi:hypothetical protein